MEVESENINNIPAKNDSSEEMVVNCVERSTSIDGVTAADGQSITTVAAAEVELLTDAAAEQAEAPEASPVVIKIKESSRSSGNSAHDEAATQSDEDETSTPNKSSGEDEDERSDILVALTSDAENDEEGSEEDELLVRDGRSEISKDTGLQSRSQDNSRELEEIDEVEDDEQEIEDVDEDEVEEDEADCADEEDVEDEDMDEEEDDFSSNDERIDEIHDQADEKDDDVAVILDSSDEEELNANRRNRSSARSCNSSEKDDRNVYDSEEVDSELSPSESDDNRDDYDDLMDDIAVSKGSNHTAKGKEKKAKPEKRERKFMGTKVMKRKLNAFDWRLKIKKRSFKWLLTKRMHNVDELHPAVVAIDYDNRLSNVTSIAKQNQDDCPFIITQIESIAEKLPTTSETASHNNQYTAKTVATEESTEMQQIDMRLDCIKKSSPEDIGIKQSNNQQIPPEQPNHLTLNSNEHNKENLGNNDKRDSIGLLQKLNGTSDADNTEQQQSSSSLDSVENLEIICEFEAIMDTSDETSTAAMSTETKNETVIEKIEFKLSDDKSSSCDTNSQIIKEVKLETEEIKADIAGSLNESKEPLENKTKNNDSDEVLISSATESPTPADSQSQTEPLQTDLPKKLSPLTPETIKKEKSPTPPPQLPAIISSLTKLPPSCTAEPAAKRSRSSSFEDRVLDDEEDVHPTKKLKAQLESNFPTHDQILNEYIDKTSNNSIDEIQKHLGQLIVEIQTLSDMIKTKELEWNNMLHLKKVKEEICFRLTRKKQIMEITSTKIGVDECAGSGGGGDVSLIASCVESLNNFSEGTKFSSAAISAATTITTTPFIPIKFAMVTSSTPNNSTLGNIAVTAANIQNVSILNNLSNISSISNNFQQMQPLLHTNATTSTSAVQNILQNRANMRSSDLVKEKATTQRLHRILVSRNILPKPATPSTTTSGSLALGRTISKSPTVSSPHTVSLSTTTPKISTKSSSSNVAAPINLAASKSNQLTSTSNDQQPILNNYLTASATIQQQLGEMLNGHHNFHHSSNHQQNNVANGNQTLGVGRQGAFKDVKSIIADYRQKHPEAVPRRGRRLKSSALSNMTQAEASNFLGNILKSDGKLGGSDLGVLLAKFDGNSRPSSNDSSHSMTNPIGSNSNTGGGGDGTISFKDVLIQFAKMSGQNSTDRLPMVNTAKNSASITQLSSAAPPPYPEVTLHPVPTSHSIGEQASGSLLHGILTKYNRPNLTSTSASVPTSTTQTNSGPNYNSSFSPTLARLLTAPERITSATHNTGASILPPYHHQHISGIGQHHHHQASTSSNSTGLNISKMVAGHNSEITITPVVSSQQHVPTLLQQQLEHQQQQMMLKRDRLKFESFMNIDDEADDSIDRLVIDEDGDSPIGPDDNVRIAPNAYGQEFHENEVPVCQGCKKQEAQFVCAGCGNQWYCSRECQVTAWDEHSEICTG